MVSQSSTFIGVKETGALETAEIIFEVQDSAGISVDLNHAVTVNFSFGSSPGGSEFLFPSSAETNALGRVSVILNTGTIAGVVHIIAEINTGSQTIKSQPVLIAIHGGFPDPGHFHVASDKLNYPAWGIVGYSIPFTAYAGDKYSNPVRPGTIIYFNTTSGIIGGSNFTGEMGTATVTLLTQPFPDHQVDGSGFFEVTAATSDENTNNISISTVRLLSGFPVFSNISPSTVDVPNGGSQTITFILSDINGNPLSEGQSINVSVETEGDVSIAGDIDLNIPDTQSPSWTNFSFVVIDAVDTVNVAQISITFETSGDNGSLKTSISGVTR
jgi:hypothetical protein